MVENPVIKINYQPSTGDPRYRQDWVFKIRERLDKSTNRKLQKNLKLNWQPNRKLGQKADSVTRKAMLLFSAILQLKQAWDEFSAHLEQNRSEIEALFQQNETMGSIEYNGMPHDITYKMLLSFDSLVFEADSYHDLLIGFLATFHKTILRQTNSHIIQDIKQDIQDILNQDSRIAKLNSVRNAYIHEKSPWLGIEAEQQTNRIKFKPVFLRYGPGTNTPEVIFRQQDINDFLIPIEILKDKLFDYLESKIRMAETPAAN